MRPYSLSCVTSFEEFLGFEAAWDQLVCGQPYEPFLSFGWQRVWLEHFLGKAALACYVLRRGEEPIAIAPFVLREEKVRGALVRRLQLAGNFYCPLLNYIISGAASPEERRMFLDMLYAELAARGDWDALLLSALPEGETVRLTQSGLASARLPCHTRASFANRYSSTLPPTGEAYLASRERVLRTNLKRHGNKLKAQGGYTISVISDGEGLEEHIAVYEAIYSKSWKGGESDPGFVADIIRMAARKGWLRLGFLVHNDMPLATIFWLVAGGVGYFVKSAYDETHRLLAPGNLLMADTIAQIIDHDGVREIDFLQGDEEYKLLWVDQLRHRQELWGYNNTVKGRYVHFLDTAVAPAVRKCRAWIR